MKKIKRHVVARDIEVQNELKRRYGGKVGKIGYFRIAQELNVNRGLLWQVYMGKIRSNRVRIALGMKCKKVETDVCPTCGQLHLMKTCPSLRKQKGAIVKKLDPDVRALRGAVRALNQSSNRKMLKANLNFLYDRYVTNPTKEMPEHLKK